ncbi:hypothetical protein [Nannocystis pusilla]
MLAIAARAWMLLRVQEADGLAGLARMQKRLIVLARIDIVLAPSGIVITR